MNRLLIIITVLLAVLSSITGQTMHHLEVSSGIRLPKDTVESALLVSTLNDFLAAIQQDAGNKWILPVEKAETELLTDEIKGMNKLDSIDCKPYLTNVEALADKKSYRVQVSYMGIVERMPVLQAIFELIACKTTNGFLFSSPLLSNTKDWNTKTLGHLTFHYQDVSAENIVDKEAETMLAYDKMLKITQPQKIYFCNDCDDISCILRLAGIIYKRDMNGINWGGIDFIVSEKGFSFKARRISLSRIFDFHDLFHSRVEHCIPQDKINRQMVCGCAYIYAGSWGMSWEDIQTMFKTRMSYDKKTDWLKLYFEWYNFGESMEKHLLVTQYINALIVQKVVKEQGFSAVMELLASGNMYQDRKNFFGILEKVAGISEKNFNKEVWKLIS